MPVFIHSYIFWKRRKQRKATIKVKSVKSAATNATVKKICTLCGCTVGSLRLAATWRIAEYCFLIVCRLQRHRSDNNCWINYCNEVKSSRWFTFYTHTARPQSPDNLVYSVPKYIEQLLYTYWQTSGGCTFHTHAHVSGNERGGWQTYGYRNIETVQFNGITNTLSPR